MGGFLKRKYKILLIIFVSVISTIIIYKSFYSSKINLVALGDGISSGEISYKLDGLSYNDYLKEYFESKKLLHFYNDSYSYKNNTLNALDKELDNNSFNIESNMHIKQILNKANIITISFGEEELSKYVSMDDITLEKINNFIDVYDHVLKKIKEVTEAKVVVLSFYENNYLTKQDVILLNSKLANIVKENDYIFINISDLLLKSEYYLTSKTIYFNYKAHKIITNMILNSI